MSEKVNKNLGEEEQRRLLISNFTDDQMERFEAYRRMTVNKPGVKKICNGIVGHTIPQIIAVVMAGVSKLFLGEIISKAFEIQERNSKGRLLMDIETKKKQKREIISSLQRGEEIEVDERALKFEGDYTSLRTVYFLEVGKEKWETMALSMFNYGFANA